MNQILISGSTIDIIKLKRLGLIEAIPDSVVEFNLALVLAKQYSIFFAFSAAVDVIPNCICYTILLVGDNTNKGEKANYIATLITNFSIWEGWHWDPLSVVSLACAIILIVLP